MLPDDLMTTSELTISQRLGFLLHLFRKMNVSELEVFFESENVYDDYSLQGGRLMCRINSSRHSPFVGGMKHVRCDSPVGGPYFFPTSSQVPFLFAVLFLV